MKSSVKLEFVESRRLATFASQVCASGEVSAVVVGVCDGQRVRYAAKGWQQPTVVEGVDRQLATLSTVFDLASLTKPFTATAALLLDEAGELPLATPLGTLVEELPEPASKLLLDSLLRHRSGLIPWFPFYTEDRSGDLADSRFRDPRLWLAPPKNGQDGTYSDLGPILWSILAQRAGHAVLPTLDPVLSPLPTYLPVLEHTAGTYLSNQREVEFAAELDIEVPKSRQVYCGIPQDGNARVLSTLGHSTLGHAGMFGDLASVLALGVEWMAPRRLPQDAVDEGIAGPGRYALGWWRADKTLDGLEKLAFGHNGFTGCSLWIDPSSERVMVMLAHRLTLSDTLAEARREFHGLALKYRI